MGRCLVFWLLCAACGRFGFGAPGAPGDAGDASVVGDVVGDSTSASDTSSDTGAASAIAMVQMTAVVTMAGTTTVPMPMPTTAGSLLVATIAMNDATGFAPPAGWQIAVMQGVSGGCTALIVYLDNGPGGATSFQFTVLVGVPTNIQITEWSNAASPALGVIGTAGSSTPTSTQPVMSTQAAAMNDTAFTSYCEDANNPTYTTPGGWTHLGNFSTNSSSPSFNSDMKVVTTPGIVAETATSSVNGKYNAALATFRGR